ncbi:unnamed protein product [Lathyrus sativus]|nr:unnamed protein product [Lathyrus sativus]
MMFKDKQQIKDAIKEYANRAAEGWIATWHADDDFAIFGVSNGVETYVVSLLQQKYGCRKWDLSGIPCCHAIACIWYNKKDPEEYVSSFYRKSTVLATYSHIIMPTNGLLMLLTQSALQSCEDLSIVLRRIVTRRMMNRG